MAIMVSGAPGEVVLAVFLIIAVPLMIYTLFKEHAEEKRKREADPDGMKETRKEKVQRTKADIFWMVFRPLTIIAMLIFAYMVMNN